MQVDISKSLLIDGWMSETELTWLAQKARTHTRIVEVGSWMGRSTRALADNTPGLIWAVDTWQGSEEHQELLADKPSNWLYEQFLSNTQDLSNIEALRMPSLEAAKLLADKKFDMIFIDASHEYVAVKQDIEAWKPLCAPGGLLAGHDYDWDGVKKAVDECLPAVGRAKALSRQYGPPDWFDKSSIWYTCLP